MNTQLTLLLVTIATELVVAALWFLMCKPTVSWSFALAGLVSVNLISHSIGWLLIFQLAIDFWLVECAVVILEANCLSILWKCKLSYSAVLSLATNLTTISIALVIH